MARACAPVNPLMTRTFYSFRCPPSLDGGISARRTLTTVLRI